MEYIRIRDKICEIDNPRKEIGTAILTTRGWVCKENIIKEADNIEDLCDVFVKKSKEEGNDFFDIGTEMFRIFDMKCYDYKKWFGVYDYYGAIWTNKGLIYVAKMNKNGEMELI